MESISAYIIAAVTAIIFILLAVASANLIQFESGTHPRDPKKRKTWFWILAVINPAVVFLLGYFIFKPDKNIAIVNQYMSALGISIGMGFLLYIIIGFVLSKINRNGKIGHWF